MEGSACTESIPANDQDANRKMQTYVLDVCYLSSKVMFYPQEDDFKMLEAYSMEG